MLLSDEKELDKIQKKRHLDFLDILLCTKVNVSNNCIKCPRTYLHQQGAHHAWLELLANSFPTPDFLPWGSVG